MARGEDAINALIKDAGEAAAMISDSVSEDRYIHVVSHLDADGLAAAGIIAKALWKIGAKFRVRIQQWVDEKIIADIKSDRPDLSILTDLGSGYLKVLNENVPEHQVVILDHHQVVGEPSSHIFQVNPHIHGIDGSREVSGSGMAYLMARELDRSNVELAQIAVVGALGDLQDKFEQRALGGLNAIIVADSIAAESLMVEKDLMFFGRETRPIHKALAYSTSPFIPGISGEEDKSYTFLQSLDIKPKIGDRWRSLRDLSEDEKQRLCSELSDYLVSTGYHSNASDLVGSVYTLSREEPRTPLRDAREFSLLLNATGRMEKAGLGVAICAGDRSTALEQAESVLKDYRQRITEYLSWLTKAPERIQELNSIYVVRGAEFINEKMIGTLSTILSTTLPRRDKPIIAYAFAADDSVKISARTVDTLTRRGLNLGEIMCEASEKLNGKGGGHDIAAGAQVPRDAVEAFITLTNTLVEKRLKTSEISR